MVGDFKVVKGVVFEWSAEWGGLYRFILVRDGDEFDILVLKDNPEGARILFDFQGDIGLLELLHRALSVLVGGRER